jgi:hypothetical protein
MYQPPKAYEVAVIGQSLPFSLDLHAATTGAANCSSIITRKEEVESFERVEEA